MVKLVHHNDGKEKWRSHEIYLKEEDFYNKEFDLFSISPFDVSGYGATKEEALKDFMRKMEYVLCEWEAIKESLFSTNELTNNMVEINYWGEEVKKF